MAKVKPKAIRLRGVRQNNLKDLDVDFPVERLTVVTGLSGAGKSSLVFDTLHAEGQRRYVETFSAYTRQFLEMLDRPKVESVENARPSIALEQANTVRTTRSTVGTMTELCDYFKVWFAARAQLIDPATGRQVVDDSPETAWTESGQVFAQGETLLVAFPVTCPAGFPVTEVASALLAQGYSRVVADGKLLRLEDITAQDIFADKAWVIQDRLRRDVRNRARFVEAATAAFRTGSGAMALLCDKGRVRRQFHEGLRSPESGRLFRAPIPALFSFNSPIGACPTCRGFGRVIEIDPDLIIPDPSLSISAGAIRPFQGQVYSNCLADLQRHARRHGLRMDVPWSKLTDEERRFVIEGEPDYPDDDSGDVWERQWYGVNRFFAWLEKNTYKMHVRVFLSKFRAYRECPDCRGRRLCEESLNWFWLGYTLPDLYRMTVTELRELLARHPEKEERGAAASAYTAIINRLRYLEAVGLGYLTLDRSSRTLSGGEVERVNLTACLGTGVVDALFVLDEPSVGLHPSDIDRLTGILRMLVNQGNTVVVVEHDERIMAAADHLIEVGPAPGKGGGEVVFAGPIAAMIADRRSLTGSFLAGRKTLASQQSRRPVNRSKNVPAQWLSFYGASKHNVQGLELHLPLGRLVAVCGVSGSGKSTLLNGIIYQTLIRMRGQSADDPAEVQEVDIPSGLGELILVDQSPLARTPRSNPAVFSGAWEWIRREFAESASGRAAGLTPGHFSFNSGDGRCPHCQGLGYERVEMQFLSDLFVPCPVCGGRRFKPEILAVCWQDLSVSEVLDLEISEALTRFAGYPKIVDKLKPLEEVGLGYLTLGQPLTTLSGGESQRLKLVKFFERVGRGDARALILIDEPTTGLHRADVGRLLGVLQELVGMGHSVVVVEHHPDVLEAADWLIEMGPGAAAAGGKIVAQGTPEQVAASAGATAPYLFGGSLFKPVRGRAKRKSKLLPLKSTRQKSAADVTEWAAEDAAAYGQRPAAVEISGAREHNLKNISTQIPHGKMTVLTGVSGSGKSTLAFDIVFAEGQRRFMESMSPHARQFVEQLPRPDVDRLRGLGPTVAIEQRVTRGTSKSTVGTITEVAQVLRLLFARVGTQFNPVTGNAVRAMSRGELEQAVKQRLKQKNLRSLAPLYLGAPVVRGRKGHYEPLAKWALGKGYPFLRCDGLMVASTNFKKLNRYSEHDIDLLLGDVSRRSGQPEQVALWIDEGLRLGKGSLLLCQADGQVVGNFSVSRVDPGTGEAFAELEPKNFSWNSPKGWCPTCQGRGFINNDEEDGDGEICPDCAGTRLNALARAVKIVDRSGRWWSISDLLSLRAGELIPVIRRFVLDSRGQAILNELLPELTERLDFMDGIGLDYLSLDRATRTLSGGEAQRIRLAAQLGSNLTGVLYVLDEPTIGLHASDNERLLRSLSHLRDRGNTLLVVEHDEAVMRQADRIIDIGPAAGIHGGEIVAEGSPSQLLRSGRSPTAKMLREGMAHPLRGAYRALPAAARTKSRGKPGWIEIEEPQLRNLRGGSLRLPIGVLVGVCGVSGAGKSTLVRDLLAPALGEAIRAGKDKLTATDVRRVFGSSKVLASLSGASQIKRVIEIDQSPIGKTPRSTPATYIGVFDRIRDGFASLPEAQVRGYSASSFSFNTPGGRCETCHGAGQVKLEMSFLPDTAVTCEECGGRRYGLDILEVRWRGRSIADVLDMTFDEAADFFAFDRRLAEPLLLMVETGLGYLRLGQSSPTLSGGEAQRLKLVAELVGRGTVGAESRNQAGNLYILEEPTIGLHLSDCRQLLDLIHRLVDDGHTLLVIEHHLDVLAEADYLVEIGPGGGENGGKILYQGPVAGLAKLKRSPTGRYLQGLRVNA